MATHSNINVKVGNVYHTVYCHWDGNVENNGVILRDHYSSQELAEKLVSGGDISSLDKSCETTEGHSFSSPVDGFTVYYGRDRGETGVDFEVVEEPLFNQSYSYIWDGKQWLVTSFDYKNITVDEALEIEEQE